VDIRFGTNDDTLTLAGVASNLTGTVDGGGAVTNDTFNQGTWTLLDGFRINF
jgi:hypothetical protein